jgi:hypothetical protein
MYMKPERSLENTRNAFYFIGGDPDGDAGLPQLYRKYTRTSSINTYGLREYKSTDTRVTVTGTADIIAGRFLDENSTPMIRTVLKIADSNGEDTNLGYDIESVKPGQTISIENLKSSAKSISLWDQMLWDSSGWDFSVAYITSDVLTVQSVNYTPEYIEIEAVKLLPLVAKRIEDIERNLAALTQTTIPVIPVAGN